MKVLALHQPVAVDLRLSRHDEINGDLERIPRHGGQHRPQGRSLVGEPPVASFDLGAMRDKTQAMLRDSIDALVYIDVVQATLVAAATTRSIR